MEGELDFVAMTTNATLLGLEAKNIREWIYPQREEITELLKKCTAVDAVPVLIARRIQFSTFRVLNVCGVILHQTYNQLLPIGRSDRGEGSRQEYAWLPRHQAR
jgi:hypothetical protein